MKEQLAALVEAVAGLTKEVRELKEEKGPSEAQQQDSIVSNVQMNPNSIDDANSKPENSNRRNENNSTSVWEDPSRTKEMKKKIHFVYKK